MWSTVGAAVCVVAAFAGGANAACNGDNTLRALRGYPSEASAACSTLLRKSVVATVTPSTTVRPVVTARVTTTDGTVTSTLRQTSTVQTVQSTTVTRSVSSVAAALGKRRAASDMSAYLASIPPASATSACSCMLSGGPPLPPVTSTATAPTGTATRPTTTTATARETITTLTTVATVTTATSISTTTSLAVCGFCAPGTQVLRNPSFETYDVTFRSTDWDVEEDGTIFLTKGPNNNQGSDGTAYMIAFVGFGQSRATLTQTVRGCPGASYSLTFDFGLLNDPFQTAVQTTTLTILLDGVTIFGPEYPCLDAAGTGCPITIGSGSSPAYYRRTTLAPFTPSRCNPELRLVFDGNVNVDQSIWDVLDNLKLVQT